MTIADNGNMGAIPAIDASVSDATEALPPLISRNGSIERDRINAFTNIVEQEPGESMKIINHWLAESA